MLRFIIVLAVLALASPLDLSSHVPIPSKSQIRRAMDAHRAAYPTCKACGVRQGFFRQTTYIKWREAWEGGGPDPRGRARTAFTNQFKMAAKQLPVHHIKSQKPFPELAADTNNLVTLCWVHHGWLGHQGFHYKDHTTNLLEVIETVRLVVDTMSVSYNESIED